jgi:ribosomal protein S18 acetylase RimI-like enzyme
MRYRIRQFREETDSQQLTLLRFPQQHLRRYRNAPPFWALLKLIGLLEHFLYVMTPPDSEKVIGTMVLRKRANIRAKHDWRIHAMFVLPEFRRKGLGEALLAHASSELRRRSADRVTLKVDSDNTPAVALYRKFGFTLVSESNGQGIFARGTSNSTGGLSPKPEARQNAL